MKQLSCKVFVVLRLCNGAAPNEKPIEITALPEENANEFTLRQLQKSYVIRDLNGEGIKASICQGPCSSKTKSEIAFMEECYQQGHLHEKIVATKNIQIQKINALFRYAHHNVGRRTLGAFSLGFLLSFRFEWQFMPNH